MSRNRIPFYSTLHHIFQNLSNGKGVNVLSAIEDGKANCDEIFNICSIYNQQKEVTNIKANTQRVRKSRCVQGRILTTDYLGFISPQVLQKI